MYLSIFKKNIQSLIIDNKCIFFRGKLNFVVYYVLRVVYQKTRQKAFFLYGVKVCSNGQSKINIMMKTCQHLSFTPLFKAWVFFSLFMCLSFFLCQQTLEILISTSTCTYIRNPYIYKYPYIH